MNKNFTENRGVMNFYNRIERRADRRLDHSLPIVLPGHKAMTKNISPCGAYIEMTTECHGLFSIGKIVQVEITAMVSQNWFPSKSIKLMGSGEVVRIDETKNLGVVGGTSKKKMGLAIHFIGKLQLMNDNFLYDI